MFKDQGVLKARARNDHCILYQYLYGGGLTRRKIKMMLYATQVDT